MKHCREIIKRLKETMPGIEVERMRSRVHIIYQIRYHGLVRHISVPVSPRDIDFCVQNYVKEAQRKLNHV